MATTRDGPNPLRPYHIPPGSQPLASPKQNVAAGEPRKSRTSPASNLGSSARDMLSDLDYSDYLNDASPSFVEMLKNLVDQGLWKYTSVLLAQPFDVAKTVLQVQLATAVEEAKAAQIKLDIPVRRGSRQHHELEDEDSGDDSASYFTSNAPLSPRTPRTPRIHRRNFVSRSPSPEASSIPSKGRSRRTSRQDSAGHTVVLKSASSLTSVVSYLWQTEGAWGVWKGTNSTFVLNILNSSLTTFLRSLLCAVLGLPDPSSLSLSSVPGGLDILSSPSPLTSLLAATAASALSAIILAPVDICRTRLMVTPSTHPPRTLPSTLRQLNSWIVPSALASATILHGSLPTLISASTPLFCRRRLGIDPVLTPTPYAVATFASQALEIAVRMPVETVLRRGQISFIKEKEMSAKGTKSGKSAKQDTDLTTVVPVGPYKGLMGTLFYIAFEEGERTSKTEQAKEGLSRATGKADTVKPQQQKRRKGQGVEGLYRGWRVGAWGLLGVWGAMMLGAPGKGGEF